MSWNDLSARDRGASNEWQDALNDEDGGAFEAIQVGYPVSYLQLQEPGRAAMLRYMQTVLTRFFTGISTIQCKERNPAHGTVWFALRFDAGTRKVLVTSSGPLANSAIGVCLRHVLEDLVAETPVPAEMTAIDEGQFPMQVP